MLSGVDSGLATDRSPVQVTLSAVYEIQISELILTEARAIKPNPSRMKTHILLGIRYIASKSSLYFGRVTLDPG
jgi:hypothetical protein